MGELTRNHPRIASGKTGTDNAFVTGTAGLPGHIAKWDANGNLITTGVSILDSTDASSNLDTALVTEKRIRDYITTQSTQQSINKKFKVNTSQFTVSPSGYTTVPQFSFISEPFVSGDILVLFSMSNKRRWGSRSYRMLFNGNVIAERQYRYNGNAYEEDWTFDIVAPITIPSDGSYNLLIQSSGGEHVVDIGCSICVMEY